MIGRETNCLYPFLPWTDVLQGESSLLRTTLEKDFFIALFLLHPNVNGGSPIRTGVGVHRDKEGRGSPQNSCHGCSFRPVGGNLRCRTLRARQRGIGEQSLIADPVADDIHIPEIRDGRSWAAGDPAARSRDQGVGDYHLGQKLTLD